MTQNIYVVTGLDWESKTIICSFTKKKAALKRIEELKISWLNPNPKGRGDYRTPKGEDFIGFEVEETPLFD